MAGEKRTRYFIRNPQSGEPWAYCGDHADTPSLIRAFGDFVNNEVGNDFGGSDVDQFTVEIKRQMMTDAEVAALPEA